MIFDAPILPAYTFYETIGTGKLIIFCKLKYNSISPRKIHNLFIILLIYLYVAEKLDSFIFETAHHFLYTVHTKSKMTKTNLI